MNREQTLAAALFAGAALAFLVGFFLLRGTVNLLGWLFRRKQERLIADDLHRHLEAIRPPRTVGESLDRWFERVVGRSEVAMSGSLAASYLLLLGVVAGAGVWLWNERVELAMPAALLAMAGLLSFYWFMHWRWKRAVQEQLPDTFHLMSRSLRAGLTVDQSVKLIAEQGEKPIAAEFKRTGEHLDLGLTVPAAFQMTAERIGLPDFSLLVSLIAMHRQTGGNLALLVDRLAQTVRSRNQFRGHVAAVTALGRLSGLCIALAAPAFLIFYYLIYPDYLSRLTESQQGLSALMLALGLEVVGVTWLLWLLRVDY
ncbi:MAG: type II secretion system F family protein [Gemmataceae bacterium]